MEKYGKLIELYPRNWLKSYDAKRSKKVNSVPFLTTWSWSWFSSDKTTDNSAKLMKSYPNYWLRSSDVELYRKEYSTPTFTTWLWSLLSSDETSEVAEKTLEKSHPPHLPAH